MFDMLLKCNDVTKRFGEILAVDHVSFNLEPGEIFGIAGLNGAGKTTLFNLISGVFKCEGEILFENRNIVGFSAHKICHLGIARTLQTPKLFSSLSVSDNVRIGLLFGGDGGHRKSWLINDVLNFAGLADKKNHKASTLSLWDKKMTMIAAALATNPKLLMLDEPIAGLNPKEIDLSTLLLRRINEELGVTLIVIEHFMKFLTAICDRLMILDNGKVLACDEPRKVIRDETVINCYLGDAHATG